MANLTISDAAAIAAIDQILDRIDLGAGAGTVQIRSGTQPATPQTAPPDGLLLGTLTFSDPAWVGGALVGNDIEADADTITGDTNADNSGTASWFRILDSDALAHIDGDITASAGGGDLELDSVSIVAGGTINISAWTIKFPRFPAD